MNTMRAGSVIGEAWRNLLSGTTRAGIYAAAFIATIGLIACLDVRSVVAILIDVEQFRMSGAAVQQIKADGMIDGGRCDALSGAGAETAGALRPGNPVRLSVLPGSTIQTVEVTPGLLTMLQSIAQPVQVTNTGIGVWLSADLAETLGASPNSAVQTETGSATVAGIYTWPNDNRARDLGYVMIIPVPADGKFSQCWAEIWPPNPDAAGLLYLSVDGFGMNSQVSAGQLNTALGASFDAGSRFRQRLTAPAPWVAAFVGLALGWLATRTRRIEVASALHARVPRSQLTIQFLIEATAWTVSGASITAEGLLWAATLSNPLPNPAIWLIGLRTIVSGSAAILIGILAGVSATREKHLFRYFKDRQ